MTEVFGAQRPAELARLRERFLAAPARVADAAIELLGERPFDLVWLTFAAPHLAGHRLWEVPPYLDEGSMAATERDRLDRALGDVYAKLASQAYNKALQIDSSNTGAQNKLSLVRELVGGPAPAVAVAVTKPPAVVAQKEPAEKKPAPAKPEPVADPTADILEAVNGWAAAWSKKDVDGYLGHYAKNFDPPGGQSRASLRVRADWRNGPRPAASAEDDLASRPLRLRFALPGV